VQRLIYAIDQFSKTIGHAFAWCLIVLVAGTCYEVFMRYVLNDPTSWAFDLSYLMYGALFYMAGAYTLSRAGRGGAGAVRGVLLSRHPGAGDLGR
jgi:TRAP-type mannitol/chloroaromatic compound transport system permease small subunit